MWILFKNMYKNIMLQFVPIPLQIVSELDLFTRARQSKLLDQIS